MKKGIAIIVLSLLWCNNLSAKIIEINKCYLTTSRGKTIQYNSWKEWNSSHKWGWKKLQRYIKQSPKPYEDVIYRIDTETGTVKQLWILTDVAIENGIKYRRELRKVKYKINKGTLNIEAEQALKMKKYQKVNLSSLDLLSLESEIEKVNSTRRVRTWTRNISDYFDKTFVILDPESGHDVTTIDLNNMTVMIDMRNLTYKRQCSSKNNIGGSKNSVKSGTAFFINNKSYLLTNNHVVEGCKSQKINYFTKKHDVQIVSTDKSLDLALL